MYTICAVLSLYNTSCWSSFCISSVLTTLLFHEVNHNHFVVCGSAMVFRHRTIKSELKQALGKKGTKERYIIKKPSLRLRFD